MKRSITILAFASASAVSLFSSLACADQATKPFTLTVSAPAARAGAAAVAHVELRPAAGYHVNKDFPMSLKLTPTAGIDLPHPTLTRKDSGVSLAETEAKFDVPYTAKEAGKKTINGTLSFAVCTATSCDPQKAPVSITVDVK